MYGPAQALLADSTPAGQRSWYYTRLAQIGFVASAVGPVVAMALFLVHGDEWQLPTLRNVLIVGIAIELPATIPLLLMRESYALDETESVDEEEAAAPAGASSEAAAAVAAEPAAATALEATAAARLWTVPYILFTSELLFALGSVRHALTHTHAAGGRGSQRRMPRAVVLIIMRAHADLAPHGRA